MDPDHLYNVKHQNGTDIQVNVCSTWNKNTSGIASGWTVGAGSFGIFIVIVSFISRKLFVFLITKIKLRRFSQEKNIGMSSTMAVYFLNYGVMYLTAPWNWIDAQDIDNEAELFFSGFYSDFSEEWYLDIGAAILLTQVINACWPLIEFSFSLILRLIPRCLD